MTATTSSPSPNPYVKRLEDLEREVADLKRIIAALAAVFTGGGANIADDDELDSKFGDPAVKKDPTERFWKGPGFVSKRLSECSPEYLDAFAKYKDFCAKMNEREGSEAKKKYAEYDRRDAARARGWARRLREGWKPPEKAPAPRFGSNGTSGFGGGGFGSSGSRPFGSGGSGFGASRIAAPPPPASSGSSASDAADADDADDVIDSGTSFDFGANVASDDEEEEAPL